MIFPPRNPPFRHETETDGEGIDRIVIVRRPDEEWFELRGGFLTRVYVIDGEEKRVILLRRFELVGCYPPEGPEFEWGFRVRLNGTNAKLPSRAGTSDAALGQFFDAHGFKHCKALLVSLPKFFEWIT